MCQSHFGNKFLMNSFGKLFRIQIYGESHGEALGIVIDGVPAGIHIDKKSISEAILKRQPHKIGTTKRLEEDTPIFLSGIFNDYTTGAPINIMFKNKNTHSKVYEEFKIHPRPGHADFTATKKYNGFNDIRGGGIFSGRLTLPIVVAGVIAKFILKNLNLSYESKIKSLGTLNNFPNENEINSYIEKIMLEQDSVGGTIQIIVKNIPHSLGEPFFYSVESCLSSLLFSIPGIKGVEFGSGFEGVHLFGSQFNDAIIDNTGKTSSNNSGGINGGITNGNPLIVTVAVRPTASIFKSQNCYNFSKQKIVPLNIEGRHDVAFILRVPIVIESAIAIGLADLYLYNKSINGV